MDEQQKRLILEWMHTRVGPFSCEVCSHVQFKVDSELAMLPFARTGAARAVDLSDCLPFVVVSCAHCANVRLFHALEMGLIPGKGPQPASPEPRRWDGQGTSLPGEGPVAD